MTTTRCLAAILAAEVVGYRGLLAADEASCRRLFVCYWPIVLQKVVEGRRSA